jgi:hypothetical protein
MNSNIQILASLLEKCPGFLIIKYLEMEINQLLTGMNLRLRDYILT